MAENQNMITATTNTFTKGMVKDMSESMSAEGVWTYARNAVNNTVEGQIGFLGNEPANFLCTRTPFTFIGAIGLGEDQWAVFSTDDAANSEVGIFDESECSYKKVVNDSCLGFKTTHIITGVSRTNYDGTRSVYFVDGLNPDRVLNLDKVPYIEKKRKKKKQNDCYVPQYTDRLDCEALRLAPLVKSPCVSLRKADTGGSMPNGSYQVVAAYTINSIRVTDYFLPSNVQSLFTHANVSGSLEVGVDFMDTEFDEFELVLISTVNAATSARKVGIYSTRIKTIYIDRLDDALPTVNVSSIPLLTPKYEKSDGIHEVNGYLIRTGINTKPDFNYQPQANKIRAKWVEVEVPADYYVKGNPATGYMRDEVYSFFIRWVYNTGEKSASYHIPGRAAQGRDLRNAAGSDALENKDQDVPAKRWEVFDTSEITSRRAYDIPEGKVTAEGLMSYWESTEFYPDDNPLVWGELCGKNIRHHKFPDNCTTHIHNEGATKIKLLGVKFEDVTHPLDLDGNPITSIVGYEILRGSREGNRTVIAKGLLNNMAEYDIDPELSQRKGLYANYPFNDLNIDPYLSKKPVKGGCQGKGYEAMGSYRRDMFTFHSPETQFRDPYLNPYELKIHGELSGTVEGQFSPVFKHPKHKLLKDFAVFTSALVGAGLGTISILGRDTTMADSDRAMQFYGQAVGSTAFNFSSNDGRIVLGNLAPLTSGIKGGTTIVKNEGAITTNNLPFMLSGGPFIFSYFFSQGMEEALSIIKRVIPAQQFAYQYNGHGFYNNYQCPQNNNTRRRLVDAQYVNPYLQDFGTEHRINNLNRSRMIALQTTEELRDPLIEDNSRVTIGNLSQWDNPTKAFRRNTSAHYASLKIKMRSQYGQMENIVQVPVSTCVSETAPDKDLKYISPVLFGGDVYINRYTEKNAFFFFNASLVGFPDESVLNYMENVNIPYPRYWIDTTPYDYYKLVQPLASTAFSAFGAKKLVELIAKKDVDGNISKLAKKISNIASLVTAVGVGLVSVQQYKSKVLPNDFQHLDIQKRNCQGKVSFGVDKGYFYLFANGVRDFFVESEINLAHRDWGEQLNERHYDAYSYTDLQTLFRSDIVEAGNYYKYDFSLSISRLFNDKITWGYVTPRDFDPRISVSEFSYYPTRAIYSLPQSEEQKRDNWRIFLANNYKDFDSEVVSIKGVNQSGAMILFKADSPNMFAGVDQLQTQNGIKVTIGDGGLFSGTLQTLSNAEGIYEQGSCQSRLAVINTPAGLFWVSQNQGKVYQFQNGLKEISRSGMKWWFAKYLPSNLLKQFPDYKYSDNPVKGVGVMLVYDNVNDILYLTKKDYRLRDRYVGQVVYNDKGQFKRGSELIELTNDVYFEDASFTISFDPKAGEGGAWISFHDWHPNYVLPSRSHFMSIVDRGIWKHNDRCDLFSNFYDKDYPWEVEYVSSTGQEVTALKNIEYQLECYRYDNDCRDRNHVLDANFDYAVVHNTEQVSGRLKLVNKPKSDPVSMLEYPIIRQNQTDILCSKEENKYRFNQFWDITKNRGEFNTNYETIWDTAANGYERTINPMYVNYQKSPLQHKKFRHYMTKVLLTKSQSDDIKMLMRLSNNKITKSPR